MDPEGRQRESVDGVENPRRVSSGNEAERAEIIQRAE